jgi:hypothetical protein
MESLGNHYGGRDFYSGRGTYKIHDPKGYEIPVMKKDYRARSVGGLESKHLDI